ncbi:MAG TPA: DUF4239 domain-containing protein [Polyangiaceae bacterium]|nr:DUF4239 domain-containing protein [Polyangiaceae bacterium]
MIEKGSSARTVIAVTARILPTVAAAEAGLCLVRACVPQATLAGTSDFVGNFIQALATVYAVLLAFVVFVVWGQFNDARSFIEREANELLDLYRTARALPDGIGRALCAHVAAYVEEVLGHEWHEMARFSPNPLVKGTEILDAVWEDLARVEPKTDREGIVLGELLSRYNDLSDLRSQRVASSRLRIPLALRIFIYTGAAMNVSALYLVGVSTFAVHALAVGALAGALAHVLYVVHDLDNAFAGDWQVSRAPFERVARYVDRCSIVDNSAETRTGPISSG